MKNMNARVGSIQYASEPQPVLLPNDREDGNVPRFVHILDR